MYTCGFRINANLVKEGSFRINAKLVKEELNLTTFKYFCITISHGDQTYFQLVIIINILVSSFLFISIPMLRVYDNHKYFHSFSAGIDFRCHNLTHHILRVDMHQKNTYPIIHRATDLKNRNKFKNTS